MSCAPDLNLVEPMVGALRESLLTQGAPPELVDELTLAVTEALTNAIRHGQAPAGETEIRLRWCWNQAWLELEVSEPGHFAPPPRWAELPEDPLCESGRGGFLISQPFDAVTHVNGGGRHALRLRKQIGPPRFSAAIAAELEQTLVGMTEDLSASYETLAALFKLAEALATTEDLSAFAAAALRFRELVEADTMHVRIVDDAGQLTLLGSSGEGLVLPRLLATADAGIEATAYRTGREQSAGAGTPLPPGDPLQGMVGVVVACPIHFQSRRLGVCVAARRAGDNYFSAAQVSLIHATAEFLGIACANAEHRSYRAAQLRVQRELEIAAQIQQSLVLADFPRHPDWTVYGGCLNALEAGGDFFDVLEVDGGLLLVIADVMGKGVPAALLAVVLRTAVRANAAAAADPGALLTRVSSQIAADLERLGMFITAQVVFAAGPAEIRYANAGHPPAAILAADPARDRLLEEGELPLGVAQPVRYQTYTVTIAAGERLLMVTDGLLEAPDSDGRELGMAGLLELVPRHGPLPVAAICAEVIARMDQRDAGQQQTDDRTLLLLQRNT